MILFHVTSMLPGALEFRENYVAQLLQPVRGGRVFGERLEFVENVQSVNNPLARRMPRGLGKESFRNPLTGGGVHAACDKFLQGLARLWIDGRAGGQRVGRGLTTG